jgi:hypothetical protein
MSNAAVMHRADPSDRFGDASRDGRPDARQNHAVHWISGNPTQADRLLERLRVVHGCPRYDLPRELMKTFDLRKFAREYL